MIMLKIKQIYLHNVLFCNNFLSCYAIVVSKSTYFEDGIKHKQVDKFL